MALKRINMETRPGTEEINSFSTGMHFYLEICRRLDHFINIRKGLWRSED
ncbi:hypothetical protein E2C01_016544 [Portunus trituberculatus]|uniref:Uncharacterized protein n=1 Tax=Portunus trituberculatus TaxID=210409 RepID=A0A5B7DR16_PORTR|nr:hypothetical protein [Portunus trituberculatus]